MHWNPQTWKTTKAVQVSFIFLLLKRHTRIFSGSRLMKSVCWEEGCVFFFFFVGFSTFIGYAICSSNLAIHLINRWHLSLSGPPRNRQPCDNDRNLHLLPRVEQRTEDWENWHLQCCQSFDVLSHEKKHACVLELVNLYCIKLVSSKF